jgi:hypothetical protein
MRGGGLVHGMYGWQDSGSAEWGLWVLPLASAARGTGHGGHGDSLAAPPPRSHCRTSQCVLTEQPAPDGRVFFKTQNFSPESLQKTLHVLLLKQSS